MTGFMIFGLASAMVGSVTNGMKAQSNRKCNIQAANELAQQYKKINDQFEEDLKQEKDIKNTIDNLKKLEDAQVKDLTDKLNNSQKDYQKKIKNIYMIF